MYFNCLAVVSDRGLGGGGEDGVDVNRRNDFSGDAQRPGEVWDIQRPGAILASDIVVRFEKIY